jgi:hypothetical protein
MLTPFLKSLSKLSMFHIIYFQPIQFRLPSEESFTDLFMRLYVQLLLT